MTTDEKGGIVELKIATAATERGIDVLRPMSEGGRYDLVFDMGGRLVRVQCKWAPRLCDVVVVRLQSSRRCAGGALRQRPYTADEIDAVAAYCPEVDRCYFLPAAMVSGRRGIHLRLAPPRNGQRACLNWAERFEFSRLDWARSPDMGL